MASPKNLKVNKTDVTEGNGKGEVTKICPLCKAEHDLDGCEDFKKKGKSAKKDFLFRNRLCFGCYGSGHQVQSCENKLVCKICGKEHPTSLHEVVVKVAAVQRGGVGSCGLCIVPVRLGHKDYPDWGLETYAMLDDCSQGTFVEEKMIDYLIEGKQKISVTVTTFNKSDTIKTFPIDGLFVKGSESFEAKYGAVELKLPRTYTKEKLPMDKGDLPNAEKIAKWEHLKEVMHSLSREKDLPFGLLIGRNCPKALEPMQVIPSTNGGPFAERTRLGWCISEEMGDNETTVIKCNRVSMCAAVKDPSSERPPVHHVPKVRMSDNDISGAFQDMYRSDFIEREGEKKAMSQEDREFLRTMDRKVKFSNGHYELPLPLRTDSGTERKGEMKKDGDGIPPAIDKPSLQEEGKKSALQNLGTELRTDNGKGSIRNADVEDAVTMPDNREQAWQRLMGVKKRMLKDKVFRDEYFAFMNKMFSSGHAQRVPQERLKEKGWFLPHHGVYHPTKKKIRVVTDCSAEKDGVSLNSVLMQGPDFSNSLLGVLLRFRKGLIPFMADIESMYYQVKVPQEHRRYLKFLWWEDGDLSKDPVVCEMCVHPFGAVSSKSCVTYALHQAAFDNKEEFGAEAMDTLLSDFYVDDLLKSVDDEQEAITLIRNTYLMCEAGGFNLTKFVCTNQRVVNSIPVEKRATGLQKEQIGSLTPAESALGLRWNVQDDSIGLVVNFDSDNETRRGCLKTVMRITGQDPCGIASPFLLKGRKIVQKMTANSTRWDEKLADDVAREWREWKEDVKLLNELKIRRGYRSVNLGAVVEISLHCYSDASFVGYGVACYLRFVDEAGKIEVSLVLGKSRVSPLKPTTVPRLELTAATVSVRLAALLMEELKLEELRTLYWVDNKIVLGYIFNKRRRFKIFVANRVNLIYDYTKGKNFRYVDTKENPADCASRGISWKEKEKVKLWLYGPHQLWTPESSWEKEEAEYVVDEKDEEVKLETKVNVLGVDEPKSVLEILEERVSSWQRWKRIMARVYRFIGRCRKKGRMGDGTGDEELTTKELQHAEVSLIRMIQQRSFQKDIEIARPCQKRGVKKRKGQLWKLNPFVDQDGLLRVGGRLVNAEEDTSFRFPIIIPKKTVGTIRLIEWHHIQIEHRGKHTTVSRLREFGFWVVNAAKEVGAVTSCCVRCKWLRGRCGEQKMADLPLERTTIEPPFTYCGVDVFGPFQVKEGRKTLKRYGVLFTCLSLRAVHIEVAASLETDSFIMALRRMTARRGSVREMRSDRGTNFVGADNELKKAWLEMDHGKVSAFMSEQGGDWIKWTWNTPSASHMGGVWERQIRTVRSVLMSLVKSNPRTLDEETLRTFFAEAEGIVNSRPLTLENLHDPESAPLTPNQILTMKSRVVLPPPGEFQAADVYCRKRWRVAQHLANCFWSRWRKEFLQLLQNRQKWTEESRNLQVDDVVLLKEDGIVRGRWPMARVVKVLPSKDGLVRSVSLKVGEATFDRPVSKTVLLVAKENSC